MPWMWLIAGPNGSGKSTLAKGLRNALGSPVAKGFRNALGSLAGQAVWINPDDVLTAMLSEPGALRDKPPAEIMLAAAQASDDQVKTCIENGISVVRETVLSTDRFKPVVESALKKGFQFGIIFVALATPEDSVKRIRLRVALGGHDVPPERTRARWARSISNLPWFAERAELVLIYDNSALQNPVLLYEKEEDIWTTHGIGRIPEIDSVIAPCLRIQRLDV